MEENSRSHNVGEHSAWGEGRARFVWLVGIQVSVLLAVIAALVGG